MTRTCIAAVLLLTACAPAAPVSNPALPDTDAGIETNAAQPQPLPRGCYPVVPPELEPLPDQVAGLPPCG